MKFGYLPLSSDLSAPGDRRRFCYYARARNLDWEVYQEDRHYDIVVLGPLADLTYWSRTARGRPKLVYDMPDSYLEIDQKVWKSRLRGAAKFAFRHHRHLELDYHASLERMFARADAVVCSTDEQKHRISALNSNVHPILDFHAEEIRHIKEDFRTNDATLNLFWEGVGGNLVVFDEIRDALQRVSLRRRVALHLLTDTWQKPFNAPVPRLPTSRLLPRFQGDITTFMYDWNAFMLSHVATACDLALIPIVMSDPLFRAKPENKLLLLWRMRVPTITSATPAYIRTMEAAGLRMYARNSDEWAELIERFASDERSRRSAGEAGHRFVTEQHSEERGMLKWDAVFESLR